MHTYALQLVLHFQSRDPESTRTEAFVEAVRSLAAEHGISLDDYQSMRLSAENYRVKPCDRCSHLTVNRADVHEGIENMLPDFWFHVRRGSIDETTSLCELCETRRAAI